MCLVHCRRSTRARRYSTIAETEENQDGGGAVDDNPGTVSPATTPTKVRPHARARSHDISCCFQQQWAISMRLCWGDLVVLHSCRLHPQACSSLPRVACPSSLLHACMFFPPRPPAIPQIVFEDTIVVKDGMSHSVIDQRVVTRESPERELSPETPRFMGTLTSPSSYCPATALSVSPLMAP